MAAPINDGKRRAGASQVNTGISFVIRPRSGGVSLLTSVHIGGTECAFLPLLRASLLTSPGSSLRASLGSRPNRLHHDPPYSRIVS